MVRIKKKCGGNVKRSEKDRILQSGTKGLKTQAQQIKSGKNEGGNVGQTRSAGQNPHTGAGGGIAEHLRAHAVGDSLVAHRRKPGKQIGQESHASSIGAWTSMVAKTLLICAIA